VDDKRQHRTDIRYADVAKEVPSTWFNTNPVNVLKSKYVYADSPHLVYYQAGKYYLHRSNPRIGAYYEDTGVMRMGRSWAEEREDVKDIWENVKDKTQRAGRVLWEAVDHRRRFVSSDRIEIGRHLRGERTIPK